MMRVVLLAACSANVVRSFATVPQKTTYACVDIGFPDDPNFKCADEAEACNDTSDLEWYNELRQICAKTCGVCGGASTPPASASTPPASSPASPSTIMILGDSWAEYSAQDLATFCKGSTVTNSGVGSSTAQEWGAASACPAPDNTRLCSAPAAFSANAGTSYTHVWLSVGGNDKMGSAGCALTVAQVTSRVTAAINAVKAAAPGAAIVMTGYCAPTTAPEGCPNAATMYSELNGGIQAACTANGATYVDAWTFCGATTSTYSGSSSPWHADSIHINTKGYCQVYSQPAVQAAFGCQPATYDCAIPAEVPAPPPALVAVSSPPPPASSSPLVVSSPPPPSTSSTPACVDIGFPDDPAFKCADEAEACNDTSDLEWYKELRQICAKTCNACGPVTG
jgi:hypothetical protein